MKTATKPLRPKNIYSPFSISRFIKEYVYPEFLIINQNKFKNMNTKQQAQQLVNEYKSINEISQFVSDQLYIELAKIAVGHIEYELRNLQDNEHVYGHEIFYSLFYWNQVKNELNKM